MVAGGQDLLLKRNTQLVKGTSGHFFRPSRSHNQPLCAVKAAGEGEGSVMFLGGIWGVGHRLHLLCTLQKSRKEQKAGEGTECVCVFWGTQTGAGGHTGCLQDVFFCCLWGDRIWDIRYKKADAVNKKRSVFIRKSSIVGVVECNDFSFQNVEHFVDTDKFLRGQNVQQTVC